MSNILNCLVTFGFSLFGCNVRQREKTTVLVKGILTTSILKYGAKFNEESQPILIELADMSVALKGGDRRKFDTDAYPEDGWVFTHLPSSVLIYPYRPTGPGLGLVPMDISD
jgi:hypothetical protein